MRNYSAGASCTLVLLVAAPLIGAVPVGAQGFLDGLGRGLGQEVGRGIGEVLRESTRPQPRTDPAPPAPPRAEPRPVPQPQSSAALSRAEVVELQQHLIELGYLRGGADGIAGPMTRRALEAFQRDRAMPADGQPTQQALRAARAAMLSEAPLPQAPATQPVAGPPVGTPSAAPPVLPLAPPPGERPAEASAGGVYEIEMIAGRPRGPIDEVQRALARLAIAAHPTLLDHEAVSVVLARLLLPDQAAAHFATVALPPQQAQRRPPQTDWMRWRGETEFERERSRAAFLAQVPPRLAALGSSQPITVRLRFSVPLSEYDGATRGFRLDQNETTLYRYVQTGGLRGRPGTSVIDFPRLAPTAGFSGLDFAVALGLALPQRIAAEPAEAEAIARAARPGPGTRRQLTYAVEAVVGPNVTLMEWTPGFGVGHEQRPLEPIRAMPRFDARVTALTLHADAEARGPAVHAFPLPGPAPAGPGATVAALGFGAMPTAGVVEERARNEQTQRALSIAVLRARPELLDRDAVLLYAAQALNDTPERYVSQSGGRAGWAGTDQFAREDARTRARTELPRFLAERALPFPLTLTSLTRMTVGEYDRERGGFALAPMSFSLPQFLRVQRVYGQITADRGLPALLPVPPADAPTLLRSLPTMRIAGSGDRPVVFLQTALRLEAPEVMEIGHDQIRLTLRGAVTEQTVFADPYLQRRLADDAALALVTGATATTGGSVVARPGGAPGPQTGEAPAPQTAPIEASRPPLTILDLHLGQGMAAARAVLARHLGEGHIVARLYRARSQPHNPQPMPHAVLMERADGSERIALYAATEGGPVIAIHHMLSLPRPMPQRDVLAELEQRYGPPDRREGGVMPAEHLGGVGTLAFGWSDGPSRPERARLPRERADCVARLQTGSPAWWWFEQEPRFGRVRGAAGPVLPRVNPGSECGPTLRIALRGAGGTDQVEAIVVLLADVRALAAVAPNTDEVPSVASFGRIAAGVPDVVGVQLGMDWDQALAAARAHLSDAVEIDVTPPPTIDAARLEPYRNGVVMVRRDAMEAVGLYREPPEAADRVVAVWRRLIVPLGAVDPAQLLGALVEKYGPPDHRERDQVYWGVAGERARACGELRPGGLPSTVDGGALAELGVRSRPGQPVFAAQIPAGTVLDGLPRPQVFGGVGEPGDPMHETRLLACAPHVAAQIDTTSWPGRMRIDQWALDEGGYVGLLDAARAALTRPAAGAAGGTTGTGGEGPTIRF